MYEEDKNLEEAIEHFQRAADYFIGEVRRPLRQAHDAASPDTRTRPRGQDAMSAANTCRVKIAHFSAQLERYQEAAEIFEDVRAAHTAVTAVPVQSQ